MTHISHALFQLSFPLPFLCPPVLCAFQGPFLDIEPEYTLATLPSLSPKVMLLIPFFEPHNLMWD